MKFRFLGGWTEGSGKNVSITGQTRQWLRWSGARRFLRTGLDPHWTDRDSGEIVTDANLHLRLTQEADELEISLEQAQDREIGELDRSAALVADPVGFLMSQAEWQRQLARSVTGEAAQHHEHLCMQYEIAAAQIEANRAEILRGCP